MHMDDYYTLGISSKVYNIIFFGYLVLKRVTSQMKPAGYLLTLHPPVIWDVCPDTSQIPVKVPEPV